MSLLEYNLKALVVTLLLTGTLCFIIYKCICRHKQWKQHSKAKPILMALAVLIMAVVGVLSCETNLIEQEGIVENCIRMGSIGSNLVNYTFYIIDDNGNEMLFNTPVISSNKYIKKLDGINEGDRVLIKYGEKLNYAIDITVTEE